MPSFVLDVIDTVSNSSILKFTFSSANKLNQVWANKPGQTKSVSRLLCPDLEHKSSTRALDLFLSWAVSPVRLQVCSVILISVSRLLRQVYLGLPCFLFSCKFQTRAYKVMFVAGLRSVCPVHLHYLSIIISLLWVG